MRRRLVLAGVLLATVLLATVLAFVLLRGTTPETDREASSRGGASAREGEPERGRTVAVATGTSTPGATSPVGDDPSASPPHDPSTNARLTQRAERVSQAMALLRFAPDSQPLRADMKDVLQPNRRHETPMPLAFATGNGNANANAPKEGELSFLFTGDVYAVVAGGSLTATLEVFRERTSGSSADRERVAVDVTTSTLSVVDPSGAKPVASGLLPSDDGREGDRASGDKVYGVTIVPAAIAGLAGHKGLVRFDVEFTASEGDRKPARASLDFRLSSAAPATFSGAANERLTADGLEITVDLHVDEAGQYFIQGLLFDAHDAPVGFATARPLLAAGRATVPLLFWGLLFHEAKATGPYVFKTLTGHRMPAPGEAERADMTTWNGPYRTRAYGLRDFSDKEYESAAKEAKLKALADLAARGSRGEPPPATSATP